MGTMTKFLIPIEYSNKFVSEEIITKSKSVAGLIGPSLIAISLSEMVNLSIWENNIASIVYLNGALLFIAGLAIVRTHNLWIKAWPVLITLVGWFGIFLGLFRMFAPTAKQGSENVPTYLGLIIILFVGAFLSFKAYENRPH